MQCDGLAEGVREDEVGAAFADLDAWHGPFSAEPVDHGVDVGAQLGSGSRLARFGHGSGPLVAVSRK